MYETLLNVLVKSLFPVPSLLKGLLLCKLLLLMFGSTLMQDIQSGVVTSLYLLCCILKIIKIKDLANTIAAALSYPSEAFAKSSGGKFNSHISGHGFPSEYLVSNNHNLTKSDIRHSMFNVPHSSSSSGFHPEGVLMQNDCSNSNLSLR
jgi:protein CLEC16A